MPVRHRLDIALAPVTHAQIHLGGGGPATHALCGTWQATHPIAHPLWRALPPLIHLRANEGPAAELQATLHMLVMEAATTRPGGATIIRRLTDVLFVRAVRAWLDQSPATTGWLGALADEAIGAALAALHAQPARAWTVADLARVATMSRSGFAARFTMLVGQPPLHYLTGWRITLAARELARHDLTVAALAESLGYASEGAFSRAFKRHMGLPPASYRRTRARD